MTLLLALDMFRSSASFADASGQDASARGPFVGAPVVPAVFDGDVRNLPQLNDDDLLSGETPRPSIPGRKWPPAPANTDNLDPVAQTWQGDSLMPAPIMNFPGLSRGIGGYWIPPDTNGDVGPNHYVQTVNVGIGIYDKASGLELASFSFDQLFDGTGTSCDDNNRGDPIVLYDPMADRWVITDFSLPAGGPYLECIAVSQTSDPVVGGWYFYAMDAGNDDGSWHDYPKLGVWPDAYYMTANMFDPSVGAKVWALDRAAMLDGLPMASVSFDLGPSYWSLLPGNLRGPLPPPGSPNYFASLDFPDTLRIWKFHVDWADPGNSTFTGPTELPVEDFGLIFDIPQQTPGAALDSLGDRLMMQLQYRNFGSHETLLVNHTVSSGGVAGVRWYEIRDPGNSPTTYQQGTYQPDGTYRWMGSLAMDQDGNMALGYSVSGEEMKPAIRYSGRLAGEIPGILPQGENSLIEGTGVQVGSNRWGDYSAMTIDPTDDCTFWYTNEYYEVNGGNWLTRIGSFRFPSCGQPKGWLEGIVHDAYTLEGIPGAVVTAEGLSTTLTVETDAAGYFSMTLPGDSYTLTASSDLPGYLDPAAIPNVPVAVDSTTQQDIPLIPWPYLVGEALLLDDNVPDGNDNGYPEPGESGLRLWETIANTGATTATNVTAHLVALAPGVTVSNADSTYPDIPVGEAGTNLAAFEFTIAPTVPCGTQLDFQETVSTTQGLYTITLSLDAKVPLPRASLFADDMESGAGNWTTGGTVNQWAITTEYAHSPSHAWSDSPGGNYADNTNAWLRSPIFDLAGKTDFALTFWQRYEMETAWDFTYIEYSLDGGATWEPPLGSYTGFQSTWEQESFDVPAFADQPNVTFRFRLESDAYVTEDGWYIDDVDLSYEPFQCTFPLAAPGIPTPLFPADGLVTSTLQLTFAWEAGPGEPPSGYNLEIDSSVITTTETTAAVTLTPGIHTWRVRAFNAAGYSGYTEAWTLTAVQRVYLPTILRNR
jgi:hypothetical protein